MSGEVKLFLSLYQEVQIPHSTNKENCNASSLQQRELSVRRRVAEALHQLSRSNTLANAVLPMRHLSEQHSPYQTTQA